MVATLLQEARTVGQKEALTRRSTEQLLAETETRLAHSAADIALLRIQEEQLQQVPACFSLCPALV
jgi:hypothetical protein